MNNIIITLNRIKAALHAANENGLVIDTLWMEGGNETVFDAFDRATSMLREKVASEDKIRWQLSVEDVAIRKENDQLRQLLTEAAAKLQAHHQAVAGLRVAEDDHYVLSKIETMLEGGTS